MNFSMGSPFMGRLVFREAARRTAARPPVVSFRGSLRPRNPFFSSQRGTDFSLRSK